MNHSTPGLPVHHQLPEFTQTHVHRVGDAIQPSHPLLSPSPPALNLSHHQGLFQWVSSLHQMAKVLEFQLQHQSFQWTLGLISFRMDWLDLLAVQRTLKSFLQCHNRQHQQDTAERKCFLRFFPTWATFDFKNLRMLSVSPCASFHLSSHLWHCFLSAEPHIRFCIFSFCIFSFVSQANMSWACTSLWSRSPSWWPQLPSKIYPIATTRVDLKSFYLKKKMCNNVRW